MKFPEELDFINVGRLPQKKSNESLVGKTCVITGTTSGVGYEAAICLAKAGAKIITIVRNPEKAKKLNDEIMAISNQSIDYFIADFNDLEEVRTAALKIKDHYPKIDILINNAGVHMTTRQLTKQGHEIAFGVNHLASFLITSILIDKMIESAPSRILQINSEGHRFNGLSLEDLNWEKRRYRGLKGYGASKTAQLMTVWELSEMLREKGVTINAMHPGAVRSAIGRNNGRLYNWYSKYIVQPMLNDPVISGNAIYYLCSSPDLEGVSGKFFNLTNEEIPAKHARNREIGKRIFEISQALTQAPINLISTNEK